MKTKNHKKEYCKNCKNKRTARLCLWIGGQEIGLCKPCWFGLIIGLKEDYDNYIKEGEVVFMRNAGFSK